MSFPNTTASPNTASPTTASPNTTVADPNFHHVTFQHPDLTILKHHKPKWPLPVILAATAVAAMLMAVLIYWARKMRAAPAEEAPTQSAPASSSLSVDGAGRGRGYTHGSTSVIDSHFGI
ncbi:uncharacterized protein [Cicer arietinum]|uniref:Uncharacterized protein LOC101496603 n=1 Tax=Cicer arietinum TaxID=3827 RepID=A0A1S2XN24_CICAR|nr:uncharacterized protein LOC101496603 [Cicer arietinum]XP_004490810.1 uncharacterized protein LOC101496923 [Cicer arietinum]XP_027187411.1 uncharacterized protein LOC101496603 [Cicer arietinum]